MSILPRSVVNPSTSVMLGIANGALIASIYDKSIPSIAAVRASESHDNDIEAARKHAAWASAGVLGFMYLLTRDKNSFLIGGLVLAAMDIMVKHANGINPSTGTLDGSEQDTLDPSLVNTYPLPNYDESGHMEMASGY